jgi:hypothetical protein
VWTYHLAPDSAAQRWALLNTELSTSLKEGEIFGQVNECQIIKKKLSGGSGYEL